MPTNTEKKIEDVLLSMNLLSKTQLDLINIESTKSGKSLEQIIHDLKLLKEEDLVRARAKAYGFPYIDLTSKTIPSEVLKKVPHNYATDYQSIAFADNGSELSLAMADPSNIRVIDFLQKRLGYRIKPYMASLTSVQNALSQYTGVVATQVAEALKKIEITETKGGKMDARKMEMFVADAPITKAVNAILEFAIKSRASDVHIEPKEENVRVRYRIDGILHEEMQLPSSTLPAIVSRIKIISNLKIDEHRVPQDGQFKIKFGNREIDVRVATAPQTHGEKLVLRLLDKTAVAVTLDSLGLVGRSYRIVKAGTARPHGMTLVTGPTGSGKTTTLNAVIRELNKEGVNIITIEDPVEYQVDGVNQIQVNAKVGLTFANALRSVLRQDPNVIMVGEIRDEETATLSVHAALTGHVVLSTLHTNNSAGILPRLLDMDIEPYLIASTVSTGVAQRLVRKICDNCRTPYPAPKSAILSINKSIGNLLPASYAQADKIKEIEQYLGYNNLPKRSDTSYTLYKGAGCEKCGGAGYLGRIAVFEVFAMSEALETLLISHPTTQQVMDLAIKEGMITMKQDGYLKVLAGTTTIDEVARVTTD